MNPNDGQIEQRGNDTEQVSSGNTPPPWHETESGPVKFRSLLHDPDATREHRHEAVELILNMGTTLGSIIWRDANGTEKTANVSTGHCCLIPAGVSHVVSGLRARGVVSLLVGGVLLASLTRKNLTEVVVDNVRHLTAQDALTGGLIAEFGRALTRPPHSLMVNALGFAVAFKLLQHISYPGEKYAKQHPPFSHLEQAKILDYLSTHFAGRLVIPTMARSLSLSCAHFTRRFRVTFGFPPLQYVLKMRVDRGLEMLRSGECRVAEAAYAVGFYDQSHFDRHCRKFYGSSPSTLQHTVV